ncbi:PD-(D/E)XK motif protein [Streptacidiphilus sp. MAP5-3]|uniref:PD-(D/E)XK motif protein n=1 Tax=unclassified Streptacidiphilus TaxID=2643834 RepID=UPI003516C17A
MSVTEEDWSELEVPQVAPGRSLRRLYPNSPVDIHLSVGHPDGDRMLVISADAHSAGHVVRTVQHLSRTAGIEIQLNAVSRVEYELRLVLKADELREVFNPLVADVAETAGLAADAAGALSSAVERYERWQDLLRTVGSTGLTAEVRRGLVGELVVLRDRLLDGLSDLEAVEAWTGPGGSNQDFQLPRAALEVKTSTAKRPQTLLIASERQLDGTGVPAMLLCLVTLDERQGGTGQSLNQVVDSIRHRLTSSTARARFDGLLTRAGYLPGQRELYDEHRYTLRDIRFWHVRAGFPRLVESDLPEGVSDCRYHVAVGNLEQYRATDDEVAALTGGNDG